MAWVAKILRTIYDFYVVQLRITGWWFKPLWKIFVSWDDDIPNIWKNKKWQPNHQPDKLCIMKNVVESRNPISSVQSSVRYECETSPSWTAGKGRQYNEDITTIPGWFLCELRARVFVMVGYPPKMPNWKRMKTVYTWKYMHTALPGISSFFRAPKSYSRRAVRRSCLGPRKGSDNIWDSKVPNPKSNM